MPNFGRSTHHWSLPEAAGGAVGPAVWVGSRFSSWRYADEGCQSRPRARWLELGDQLPVRSRRPSGSFCRPAAEQVEGGWKWAGPRIQPDACSMEGVVVPLQPRRPRPERSFTWPRDNGTSGSRTSKIRVVLFPRGAKFHLHCSRVEQSSPACWARRARTPLVVTESEFRLERERGASGFRPVRPSVRDNRA